MHWTSRVHFHKNRCVFSSVKHVSSCNCFRSHSFPLISAMEQDWWQWKNDLTSPRNCWGWIFKTVFQDAKWPWFSFAICLPSKVCYASKFLVSENMSHSFVYDNQLDGSKIQHLFCHYMFRASSVPIIRSYLLYARQLVRFMQLMWPLPSRDRLERSFMTK